MCQILQIKIKGKNLYEGVKEILRNKSKIKINLNKKGGDNYSVFLFYRTYSGKTNIILYKDKKFEKTFDYFKVTLKELFFEENLKDLEVVWFSRQVPEMESEKDTVAPYFVEDSTGIKRFLWLHGTIANDKELAKKYNISFNDETIDSEILLKLFEKGVNENEIKGLYTYLFYNNKGQSYWINKGMGAWKFDTDNLEICAVTPELSWTYPLKGAEIEGLEEENYKEKHYYIAYSGGMDISLSTYKIIADWKRSAFKANKLNIHLIYFDYKTQASTQEKETLEKFRLYIKRKFPENEINIDTEIIDCYGLIKNFVNVYDNDIKFFDLNAKGSEAETEENLSYVPFRNSLFVELLKTKMDGNNLYGDIVLGLNLSEGQVFGDNNSYWLEGIERVARVGGKTFNNIKVISPYINRTKTNMIKEFAEEFGIETLNEILEIAFSCYYPKPDGSACGECGSCILRKKALERALKK